MIFYFIFHEGPGQRLAGSVPQSFFDINLLRTGLQHDLDHGKPKEAASKRRAVGQAFKKYAGVTTPDSLAPERFPLVQAALMTALEGDLRGLTWP
jgi:hypothetical protein